MNGKIRIPRGLWSPDGVIHTRADPGEKPQHPHRRDHHGAVVDPENAKICLTCTRKHCHGTCKKTKAKKVENDE